MTIASVIIFALVLFLALGILAFIVKTLRTFGKAFVKGAREGAASVNDRDKG